MHWIIQDNYDWDKGTKELINILERNDVPHTFHKVIPFVGDIEPEINPKGYVICIGSYSMRHVAKKYNWYPGVYDIGHISLLEMNIHWGHNMLNYNSRCIPFGSIPEYLPNYDNDIFIRPIFDSKVFSGNVFQKKELMEWHGKVMKLENDHTSIDLTKDTMIIMAPPKPIWSEYRTWIVNNRVITASQYKSGGRVVYSFHVDQYIIDFAQYMANIWGPAKTYVLDIGITEDGPKIVEANTLNAARFYHCDMFKLWAALEMDP